MPGPSATLLIEADALFATDLLPLTDMAMLLRGPAMV